MVGRVYSIGLSLPGGQKANTATFVHIIVIFANFHMQFYTRPLHSCFLEYGVCGFWLTWVLAILCV